MAKKKNPIRALTTTIGTLAGITALGGVGWILYSRRYIDHHAKLKGAYGIENGEYETKTAGKVHYFADPTKNRKPLLILHGVHYAAGSQDIKPIFEAFRSGRAVYTFDLPGFGRSEKSNRAYLPSLYEQAILEFIEGKIGQACDVIALGLACEFAARAALQAPEWIEKLVLVNPTGFHMPQAGPLLERPGWSKIIDNVQSILTVPLWSLPLYDVVASRPNIAAYYKQRFEYYLPDELVTMAYASAHQPGAHFAPIVHMAGKLFTSDVREKVYGELKQPVLVVYDNEPGLRLDMLPGFLREHTNWKAVRMNQTWGMPHFDKPGEFFHQVDMFLNKPARGKTTAKK